MGKSGKQIMETFSQTEIPLFDFIAALSRTIDIMAPEVADHHFRTTLIALEIASAAGLSPGQKQRIGMGSSLHDIGAFYQKERLQLMNFETGNVDMHCIAGACMLEDVPIFQDIAPLIRYHHTPWETSIENQEETEPPIPPEANLLCLADRVAVLFHPDTPALAQADAIRDRIRTYQGSLFAPQWVEAFLQAASRESFWFSLTGSNLEHKVYQHFPRISLDINLDRLETLGQLLCRVIDFKSPFTAAHSKGVAACAEQLARLAGFSPIEQRMMRIAAFFHDAGKLAIPSEILEKPGPLDHDERSVMMGHVYFTYEILQQIPGIQLINMWASLHQEHEDGTGYPFHYTADKLPLGSRIMAVADVFTAITEDRPYRKGMGKEEAISRLHHMVEIGHLSAFLVTMLLEHFDEIDAIRARVQEEARREYDVFHAKIARQGISA